MSEAPRLTRRALLGAGLVGGGALVGAAAGLGSAALVGSAPQAPIQAPTQAPTQAPDPFGVRQAGIVTPTVPQANALVAVFSGVASLGPWLGALGERIAELSRTGMALPDGSGDLSVTVGVGPRLVAARGSALPGAEPLPAFRGDASLATEARGGDLCLQLCASDPLIADLALEILAPEIPGALSFRQRGYRPPSTDGVARTPLGFHDGIANPRSEEELAAGAFLTEGPLAGASIWVIRRFRLDIDAFRGLSRAEREAAIGRREGDGAPLSGGEPRDDIQLESKRPDGEYLVPLTAHARRAHPSYTGSPLMLRRSYSYDNGADDRGIVFISFQNQLRTFVETQRRLDEADRLLDFATPTASFGFLALPGFDADRPLGAALWA